MNKALVSSVVLLSLVAQTPALGQPRRPPPPADRRAPPPPPAGWDRRQWDYRQDYLRRHGDRRDDRNDAIIAGLLGFALGAAIAGSQEEKDRTQPRLRDPDWIAYCARKYRSFDPQSGTYLARDGLRRYCR